MAKTTTFNEVEGLNRTLRALTPEASKQLRDVSKELSSRIADRARERALDVGGVLKLVAPSIRARRDRVPTVALGGNTPLPVSGEGWERSRSGARQTVGDVVFGAEFGGRGRPRTMQFLPHLGTIGYAVWPTVRDMDDEILAEYSEGLRVALERV